MYKICILCLKLTHLSPSPPKWHQVELCMEKFCNSYDANNFAIFGGLADKAYTLTGGLMTKLDRLIVMEKTAAPTWLRNTGTVLGKGLGLFIASTAGSQIGSDIATLSHGGGRVGAGPKARWEKEYRDYVAANTDPKLLEKGNKARERLGLLGLGVGALAALPFTRKPLLLAGAGLSGRSAGRWLAKVKNPSIAPEMSAQLKELGQFRGMMSDEEASAWMKAMHSPELAQNPSLRNQLVGSYTQYMGQDPEYQSLLRKKRIGKVVGSIAGMGALTAGMLMGRKPSINTGKLIKLLEKGKTPAEAFRRANPTTLQSAIGGKTYWPWLGLGVAGMGIGAAKTIEGGRRGGVDPDYTRKKVLEELASQGGSSLLYYGGGPS